MPSRPPAGVCLPFGPSVHFSAIAGPTSHGPAPPRSAQRCECAAHQPPCDALDHPPHRSARAGRCRWRSRFSFCDCVTQQCNGPCASVKYMEDSHSKRSTLYYNRQDTGHKTELQRRTEWRYRLLLREPCATCHAPITPQPPAPLARHGGVRCASPPAWVRMRRATTSTWTPCSQQAQCGGLRPRDSRECCGGQQAG